MINEVKISQKRLELIKMRVEIVQYYAFGIAGLAGLAILASGGLAGFAALALIGGAIAFSGIVSWIHYLWQRKQYKSVELLCKILENLNKLKAANVMFLQYMHQSTETANAVLSKMGYIRDAIVNGSERYRKKLSENVLKQSIIKTKAMISIIDEVTEFHDQLFATQFSLKPNKTNCEIKWYEEERDIRKIKSD